MNDCCLLSEFLPHTHFGIEVLRILYETTSLHLLHIVLLLQPVDFSTPVWLLLRVSSRRFANIHIFRLLDFVSNTKDELVVQSVMNLEAL